MAGRVAEAAGALQAARDAGLAPTVVTYASVAKGHAMRGEYEAASGVLDQMEADGVAPNVRWSREGAQGEHRGSRDGAEIPARETRAVGARRRRTRHTSKEPLHAARCSAQPALSLCRRCQPSTRCSRSARGPARRTRFGLGWGLGLGFGFGLGLGLGLELGLGRAGEADEVRVRVRARARAGRRGGRGARAGGARLHHGCTSAATRLHLGSISARRSRCCAAWRRPAEAEAEAEEAARRWRTTS